ncbi:hypothetical protein YN1_3470 [Nanoarchaeota archaeon]
MKEKLSYILFIILLVIIAGIIYKISYSKTLAFIPILILIIYLLENRDKIFAKKENI